MGRIVSNFFISLDGVVESPDQWHFPYFDDEMGSVIGAGMESAGAFMMGRNLYGEWSDYWTTTDQDQDFAKFINAIPKYVVSSTLTDADVTWNNSRLITGDQDAVRAGIQAAKDETEGDIQISGNRRWCARCSRWGCSTSSRCCSTRSRSGTASGCSRTLRRTRWSSPRSGR